jgi:hypothetical protein
MSNLPVIFSDPDNPEALAALHTAFETQRQQNFPIIGMLFKVVIAEGGTEQLVNWEVVDSKLIESLALGLAISQTGHNQASSIMP